MGIFRKNIERMTGYAPGEQPSGGGYIKLNTNENPYPPSPRVMEAIAAETERLRLYPDPLATKLRERIAAYHQQPLERILVGNGSDDLLTVITRTFAGKGDTVVSPTPTYTLYRTLCEIQEARYITIPFREDYSLDAGLIPSRAKIVFAANPNSPSGTLLSEGTLARIASAISGVLVVDEAYVDFSRRNCMGLLEKHENVIILRSFSKSFSLAGMRIGYAVANGRIIENLIKVKDSYNVNRLAVAAGIAALDDIQWMKANVTKVIATRRRLIVGLEKLGFAVKPSEANFILVRIRGYPAAQVYERLKRKKILVRFYDTPRLRDSLRISVGTDAEIDELLTQVTEITGRRRSGPASGGKPQTIGGR